MLENIGQLHPNAGQIIDVEETSVVDIVGCDTEMGHAPTLLHDKVVEDAPGFESPWRAIYASESRIDSGAHVGAFSGKPCELGF